MTLKHLSRNLIGRVGAYLAVLLASVSLLVTPLLAKALIISPLQIDLASDPGTTIGSTFSVYDDSDAPVTLYTQVQNFEAQGEEGNPKFVNTKDGLVSWVSMPASVVAPARSDVKIPFTVAVPKNAEPSGYFAGLFTSTTPPATDGSTNVSLGNRVGALLLFRANGDISEGISILEFGTPGLQHLFSMLPIDFYYRFQNSGADRIQPLGDLIIKNTFGFTTRILNANQVNGNVLPNSIRRFETAWVAAGGNLNQPAAVMPEVKHLGFFSAAKTELTNFAFGMYTAHLNLAYGNVTAKSATADFTFFVFPWQLILIIVILLLIIFFSLRFFMKRYNRYIIEQANKARQVR